MVTIKFTAAFKKAYRKMVRRKPEASMDFIECLLLFMNNPFDKQLDTHKLKGSLSDLYSFSVQYDLRVIFYFISDTEVIFEDIGTHDEVY